jgi:phosphoribosylaminoimidazolecarboxamide formyltransferase/IMP cyclohydrolase
MAPKPVKMSITLMFEDGTVRTDSYMLEELRNGDNLHQKGYVGEPLRRPSYDDVIKGRGMSFTNHLDMSAYATAFEISKTMEYLKDSRTEAVVINKHTNPAVYAARENQIDALIAALAKDSKSPFGGTMATSHKLRKKTAEYLVKKNKETKPGFVLDVLAATDFEKGSIELLTGCMKNLRIVNVSKLDIWDKIHAGMLGYNMKWTIGGKVVITEVDKTAFFNSSYLMERLSKRQPMNDEITDAHIAWIGAKAIQSNSFAFVKDATLLAQCGGQTNRVDSAKVAKMRADEFKVSLEGSAAATDSFIFDREAIDLLYDMGVTTVVQPTRKLLTTGKLDPDEKILNAINEHDMIMLRPYLVGEDGQEKPWRVFRHI